MTNLDRPSRIPRLRHDLDPVRARQRASAADAVVEALRDARIGERINDRPLCSFLGNANHALDRLALTVEARTHERARRKTLAHREPERKRSSLEHDLVARRDLERRRVNVVDLRGRNERARRKAERRVWERGKKESQYSNRDCRGDETRLYRPSRELLLRGDRLDVLHSVLGDLLHEPRGRSEVARLRELHNSRKSLLEFRVVALDEGGDLGRGELAPERLYESEPANRHRCADAARPKEPANPRDIDRHHRVNRHDGENRGDEHRERGTYATHKKDAADPGHALVELGRYLRRYILVFHGVMRAKLVCEVSTRL